MDTWTRKDLNERLTSQTSAALCIALLKAHADRRLQVGPWMFKAKRLGATQDITRGTEAACKQARAIAKAVLVAGQACRVQGDARACRLQHTQARWLEEEACRPARAVEG